MLYLTCTMISSVDLAHYRVSRAKVWISVDCGTTVRQSLFYFLAVLENSSCPWVEKAQDTKSDASC